MEGGVGGEVVDLVWIGAEVVELFGRAFPEPVFCLIRGELACFVELLELDDCVVLVAVLGLEEGAVEVVIFDIAEFLTADAADAIDGVVTAVTSGDNVGAGLVICSEEVAAVEVGWHFGSAEGEGGGGEIKARNEVMTHGAGFEGGVVAFNHTGNVEAAFVAKLFVAE